jgi:hypothetical protein
MTLQRISAGFVDLLHQGAATLLVAAGDEDCLPVLQRMNCLFFVFLVMHLWEEVRFPGGFVELITKHPDFTASSREFGEIVTDAYVLIIAFVPIFFPNLPCLGMAAMMLGVMEAIMQTAMIRIFRMKHFYSPGLATAAILLLPTSLYTFTYVIRGHRHART